LPEKRRGGKASRSSSRSGTGKAGKTGQSFWRRLALPAPLRRWLARISAVLLVFFVVLPLGLVLVYRL